MKKQSAVWVVLMFCLITIEAVAQSSGVIQPQPLSICDSKTTNLIFPFAIKSVDRGSRELLVQKASDVENVLQVKAAGPELMETNLTVMTADGRLYSYLVNYSTHVRDLNIVVEINASEDKAPVIFGTDATNDKVREAAARVIHKKTAIKSCNAYKYDMKLSLEGIYAESDKIYFQVKLKNDSWIDYPIRELRLFLKDNKNGKRTTIQEIELQPLYLLGNQKIVHNRSGHNLVIALPSFTIPDQKRLILELQEANGGRHLKLAIKNKHLIKAWRIF